MGLFSRAVKSPFLVRRFLVELRRIANALERSADVQELLAQHATQRGGQAFRSFSREKSPSDGEGTSVSYMDPQTLERQLLVETELLTLLGRQPTPEELDRAMAGDVE